MKLTSDNILVMPDHQQISDNVEQIAKEIKKYNREDDLVVLENLRDLCMKEKMTLEMIKMYRNIGMYHFYTNNLSEAIISMQLAVDLLRQENYARLLVGYYSELGLIYFYNHEYLYAKRYYEEAEGLLSQVADVNKYTIYIHYYRYGTLLSNMQEYELAKQKLEKALSYAEENKDISSTTMNLGLLYKRQKDFKSALKYYSKALWLVGDKDIKIKSVVYNNIAEVYKILGQYSKALKYVDKAFKCITDNDMSLLFVYFNTYTEIKILMGERKSVLDDFLELLVKVEDFHLYKGLIIEGISNMIVIGSEDRNILNRLELAIMRLIENNTYNNEEYIKGLRICIENIRLCRKELKD